MVDTKISKYERAQERIAQLKKFYNHVAVYVVINALLLFLRAYFGANLFINNAIDSADFLNWIDWNTFGTAIVWGLFLGIHALKVFGKISVFGKRWEQRQIKKYMDEDER